MLLFIAPHCRKKEIEPEPKVNTGIDYLKTLVAEQKERKETLLFGPKLNIPSDNRFILTDLLTLLERKGFHLSSFERKEIQKCFDTYGPFDRELASQTLENIIKLKGTRQHISFYLEKLAVAQIKRRRNHA